MSLGSAAGSNAMGHRGWVRVRCVICAKWLDITSDDVYVCPKCRDTLRAYFCYPHAKNLHYKCPYCKNNLTPL